MDEEILNPLEEMGETLEEQEDIESAAGNQETQEKNTSEEMEGITQKVDKLQASLDSLQKCFDKKIATDQHKNQLFDNMHKELVEYQNGNLDKVINSIAVDIILLIDDIKKNYKSFCEKERNEENYEKLLKMFFSVSGDLDDILYRQSIEPYQIDGDEVNVRKQKIIGTIPTNLAEQENLIGERVAEGYEKNGMVIRPERVKIYKFVQEDQIEKN